MPTLQQLFQLEALVPAAARDILAPWFADVRTSGRADPLPRTMVAAQFYLGPVTGRQQLRAVRGQPVAEFAEYTGTLEIDLGVAREENQAAGSLDAPGVSRRLSQELAHIRTYFLNHPPPFAGRLPWWQVTEIRPLPTSYDQDPERQIDFATLSWQLTLCLLPGVWPVVE